MRNVIGFLGRVRGSGGELGGCVGWFRWRIAIGRVSGFASIRRRWKRGCRFAELGSRWVVGCP